MAEDLFAPASLDVPAEDGENVLQAPQPACAAAVLTYAHPLLAPLASRFTAPAEVTGTFDLHGKYTWSGLRFCTLRREADGGIYTLRTFADKAAFDGSKPPQSERAVAGFGTDVPNRKGTRQHRFDVVLGTGETLKLAALKPEMKEEWMCFLPSAAPGAALATVEGGEEGKTSDTL